MTAPFGIYVHSPFCREKCAYCDFNSYAAQDHLIGEYAAALENQISKRGPAGGRPVTSIYFGGGNPLLLGEAVFRLLEGIRAVFPVAVDAEITLEANPEDSDAASLKRAKKAGFNRLSLGWQTLDDERLSLLGRRHTTAAALASLEAAREAGFANVGVDLIFGLPGQSQTDWRRELASALAAGPDHVSAYMLTVAKGTPLAKWAAEGTLPALPGEDDLVAMYHAARASLAAAGFNHYEISNFARAGHTGRHNVNYWTGGDYLGLGAGAHSHRTGTRWWNEARPAAFIEKERAGEEVVGREELGPEKRVAERIILELRLTRGADLEHIRREFGVDPELVYAEEIERVWRLGLIKRGSRLALTEKGLPLANEVMAEFA